MKKAMCRMITPVLGAGIFLAGFLAAATADEGCSFSPPEPALEFSDIDPDNDGVVSYDKMEGMFLHMLHAADTDGDDLLSREEYIRFIRVKRRMDSDSIQQYRPGIGFSPMDADRDGMVSLDDMIAVLTEIFSKGDLNEDTLISAGEFSFFIVNNYDPQQEFIVSLRTYLECVKKSMEVFFEQQRPGRF